MLNIKQTLLWLCLSMVTPWIYALPEDSKAPLTVHADFADLNQSQHRGIYKGHIELDQGTTHIRAISASTMTNKKNQLVQAIIKGDSSTQAHYWVLPQQDKPVLHAYANKICYCPLTHTIVLSGNAKVIQGQNRITAATIYYNSQTQHLVTPQHANEQTIITVYPATSPSLEPHP